MKRLVLMMLIAPAFAHSAAEEAGGGSADGGDPGGSRYSSLAEITAENVDKLQVAWIYRTGELGQGVKDWSRSAFEATPILFNGTLYLTTSSTDVIAVNAANG